ncbi:uncharacterized protein isoform X2 [Leptinotarsa decemlineata]|uniref:uncharacterized protein isoform X2 n=1 Tax=Leptinotarsa decemlineata TaxID=7539 RepID=UPI003D30A56B
MDQYCVVEFDDGILSCVKADKLRSNNGQHSARWKNAWYHVAIILIGEQDQCESFVKNKHKEQVTECTNNNELCNEDEPNASSNALSEPYGSDYSDVDPNFVPKESSDEDSSLSNDSLSEDSYVYEQAKSSNAGISESLGNDLNNNSKCYPEQFNKMAATSTDVLSNNVLLNKKIYTADIPVSIVLEKMQSYVPPNNEMPLDPIIPNSKQGSKKYFCKYCKNMFTKLPSHFEKKHKEEEEVRKFLILPKVNNPARESPTINYPARDSWDNPLETSYGRQRCVSPMGQVRKRSWGANEVQIVTTLFSKHLQNRTLPTTPECFAAIESNDSLSGRTAAQLKSWMSNQFRKKSNEKCRKIMRAYWTEEEKEIMFKIFERNLKGGILPGLKMCTEVQNKYPQLRHRTAVTLRAWVNNTIKKNSKTKNV